MRIRQLLDTLVGRDPDDIVAIGVHIGADLFDSCAISQIIEGDGIVLLYTPKTDEYKRVR